MCFPPLSAERFGASKMQYGEHERPGTRNSEHWIESQVAHAPRTALGELSVLCFPTSQDRHPGCRSCEAGKINTTAQRLECVTQPHQNAAVTTVGRPLVEEVGAGVDRRVWRAKVASIGRVEEFGAELQVLAFHDLRVLEDAEVQVGDAVTANRVASNVA